MPRIPPWLWLTETRTKSATSTVERRSPILNMQRERIVKLKETRMGYDLAYYKAG